MESANSQGKTGRLFLEQSNDRHLESDYAGDVLVWDIDKTYLDTHFSSWRGLLRIPFEAAVDKRSLPGSVPLLRALRRGPGKESLVVPLFFVSGSPPQLRSIIERRMLLDGVDFDGITFKDQWGLVRARRHADLRRQVGYKLKALLLYRQRVPDAAKWLLFGDDVEQDADVFTLFGEVCAGLRHDALDKRLRQLGISAADLHAVLAMCESLPVTADPVERVFIHLEQHTAPERFTQPRVVTTRSYLQTALVLTVMGKVRADTAAIVARDLRVRGTSEEIIREHLEDAVTRLGVERRYCAEL